MFIRVHPLLAIALAQARWAGWFSSPLFTLAPPIRKIPDFFGKLDEPLSYFLFPIYYLLLTI
jgi:hypothetical protein